MFLIRNHGEVMMKENFKSKDISNIIGYNFRMGELEGNWNRAVKKIKKLFQNFKNFLIN